MNLLNLKVFAKYSLTVASMRWSLLNLIAYVLVNGVGRFLIKGINNYLKLISLLACL